MTKDVVMFVLAGSLAVGPVAHTEPPLESPLSAYKGKAARVASTLSGGATVEGILLDVDVGSIRVLSRVGKEETIPVESIRHMELALGKKRHVWQGALIGAAAGVGIGFTDKIDPQTCSAENNPCSRAEAVALAAGGSALIGAVVGAFIKTTRWSPVAVDALKPPPGAVRQSRAALGFELTVRF